MIFKDRYDAGKKLSEIMDTKLEVNPIILALPRGGVPVAYEIAKAKQIPLDVIIARKIGMPGNEEYGIGAISESNVTILDTHIINNLGIPEFLISRIIDKEKVELHRRLNIYRQGNSLPDLKGRTVLLVDDGLATGITARAAISYIQMQSPTKTIFAVPVCASDTFDSLHNQVDQLICLNKPVDFTAVGQWYNDFSPVSDEEIINLLRDQ